MRIILLSPLPPYRGGIAQFGKMLGKTLETLGHDLVYVNYSRLYPGFLFPGKTQLEEGGKKPQGLIDSCNPLSWLSARKKMSAMQGDLLITQWWHPFFAVPLLASIPAGIRTVAVCHNVLPHEKAFLGNSMTKRFFSSQDFLAVHSGDSLETASEFHSSIIRLFLPLYDQYIGTGLQRDAARKLLGLQSDQTALLFFGLVRGYKGLDILLEACELLPKNYVVIAAGEDYTGRTIQSARMIRDDRFIPDHEVGTWFNASDMVVLPYRNATQSAIAQIGLSFCKPMVVTPVGGLPEVVEDGITGTISADTTPEALASAILRCRTLLDVPETEAAIARKAADFSWRSYAMKLLEAVE